jgi:hypothetical protein
MLPISAVTSTTQRWKIFTRSSLRPSAALLPLPLLELVPELLLFLRDSVLREDLRAAMRKENGDEDDDELLLLLLLLLPLLPLPSDDTPDAPVISNISPPERVPAREGDV